MRAKGQFISEAEEDKGVDWFQKEIYLVFHQAISSISNAKLYFYINSSPTPSGATIFLYKLDKNWAESEATWQTALSTPSIVAWNNNGGDYSPTPIISTTTTGNCWVELDVTTLVQNWITNPSTNFGIILIASGPSGPISIPSRSEADGPVSASHAAQPRMVRGGRRSRCLLALLGSASDGPLGVGVGVGPGISVLSASAAAGAAPQAPTQPFVSASPSYSAPAPRPATMENAASPAPMIAAPTPPRVARRSDSI
jgi:hypothetical protein